MTEQINFSDNIKSIQNALEANSNFTNVVPLVQSDINTSAGNGIIDSSNTPGFPLGYQLTKSELQYASRKPTPEDKNQYTWEWLRLSNRLNITALTHDENQENWGKYFELWDSNNNHHKFALSDTLEGPELRKELQYRGCNLALNQKCKMMLESFISSCHPKARITCVEKAGWHGNIFVLPHKVYSASQDSKEVVFQSLGRSSQYNIKGTITEWNENVGKYFDGNPLLWFVGAAALTAPFLTPLNQDSLIIHLDGKSSIGKTTALLVANSIWGIEKQTWRTTDNALESACFNANDGLLTLDELSEVNPKVLDAIIYGVGNEQGKARAKKNASGRPILRFKNVVISSGEVSVASKMNEIGQKQKAGSTVRVLELNAESSTEHGIFKHTHDMTSKELSEHLKHSANKYQGSVIDQLLTYLTANKESAMEEVSKLQKSWEKRIVPPTVNSQVQRVGKKFALIYAVGEFASKHGLFPNYTNHKELEGVFNGWVEGRGGNESHEIIEIKNRIRLFIQEHGNSKFQMCSENNPLIYNRAGYKKFDIDNQPDQLIYYFLPEVFKKEILKGCSKNIFKELGALQIILPGSDKNSRLVRVYGFKNAIRLIEINSKILED